jgi:hypothetical protein
MERLGYLFYGSNTNANTSTSTITSVSSTTSSNTGSNASVRANSGSTSESEEDTRRREAFEPYFSIKSTLDTILKDFQDLDTPYRKNTYAISLTFLSSNLFILLDSKSADGSQTPQAQSEPVPQNKHRDWNKEFQELIDRRAKMDKYEKSTNFEESIDVYERLSHLEKDFVYAASTYLLQHIILIYIYFFCLRALRFFIFIYRFIWAYYHFRATSRYKNTEASCYGWDSRRSEIRCKWYYISSLFLLSSNFL